MGDSVRLDVGAFVGRFNPLHKGHMRTADRMIYNHGRQSLLMIGSANAPLGLRNLFTYRERRDFIKMVYPKLRVVPLPDFPSDADWFNALIDITEAAFPFFHQVILYCGDINDISSFDYRDKVTIQVVDRYQEQVVSATEVRTSLMQDDFETLKKLLPEQLWETVYGLGRKRLQELLRGVA